MGTNKFAPVTSLLLARKGDAGPSVQGFPTFSQVRIVDGQNNGQSDGPHDSRHDPVAGVLEPKFVFSPPADPSPRAKVKLGLAKSGSGSDAPPEKPRRIVLNLTPQEYETLGLVAVKKGVTRHELAQGAIDAYFDWLVEEYAETCACVVGGATARCECKVPQKPVESDLAGRSLSRDR